MSWLDTPPAVLRAFARKISQLQAEESLHLSAIAAVGSGALKDPDAITSEWTRVAQGRAQPRPSAVERRAFAGMLGIQVVSEDAS